jgi:hypothetical protein
MKTSMFIFVFMIAMIMGTTITSAQVTVTGSIQVNAESVSEVSHNNDIYTVIDRSAYNDFIYSFDQTGQIFEKNFSTMPGSDEFGTYVQCASGNFAVVRDYYTDAYGYSYGLYYRDPEIDSWTRIRSYGKVSAFSILSSGTEAIVTVYAGTVSELGNTLVGDTYGGLRGEDGLNFSILTESSTVIHRVNSSGAIIAAEIIDHEVASSAVGLLPTPSGVLIKMTELVSENIFYQLLHPITFVRIWESEIYDAALNVTVEEMDNGNFIFGVNFLDSDSDFLVQYDGELLNPKISDDMEYPYGVSSYPAIFANDTLCIVPAGNGIVCSGSQELDLRYILYYPEFYEYSGFSVDSVDFSNMRAHVRVFYTGSGNTLAGSSLLDIEDGKIGVAFANIDLTYSGEKITLNDDVSGVVKVFDNHERLSAESNEMVITTKHVSALQVTEDYYLSLIPGATVDSDLYTGPGDYTVYPAEWAEEESGELFFVVAIGKDDFSEAIYQKVFVTIDDLFVPFVNTPPTILGLVDGVLDGGSIYANSNHEFVVNGFDPDGDILTLVVDINPNITVVNDEDTHAFFVDVENEIIDFGVNFWLYDGTDSSEMATFVVDIEGYLNIMDYLGAGIGITVYPNPTTDFVTVDGCEFELIQVYNTAGSLIIETNESKIDFSDLPVGGYVLHIFNGDNIAVTKVVKQ